MSNCTCRPQCDLSDTQSIDGFVDSLLGPYGASLSNTMIFLRGQSPPSFLTGKVSFVSKTGQEYALTVTGRGFVEILRSATTMAAEYFRRGDWT